MSVFIDTSVWFASIVERDRHNDRAKAILAEIPMPVTSDHVIVETWQLLANRHRRDAAERFWRAIRGGIASLILITEADLDAAWAIGRAFPDQDFSIVDRTSFAVMQRLEITRAASFDAHFAIYRYGRERELAFEVLS